MRMRSLIGSAVALAALPITLVVAGPALAAAGPPQVAAAGPLQVGTAGPLEVAPGPARLEPVDDRGTDARVSRIGEAYSARTDLAYTAGRRVWRTVIRHPGATYIKVHFARLALAAGDHVTVADPTGREVHTYRGDPTAGTATEGDASYTVHGRAGFAAMSVDGDTAVVTLHAARARPAALARQGYGVRIDGFWRGFSEAEIAANNVSPSSVCGVDARRDAVCYRTSHPTEYALATPVARLVLGGRGLCTGWRVGRTNRMLTNNHCTASQAGVAAAEAQFNFECATCGGNNPHLPVKVGGAQMLRTNGPLDYTLFSVNNFATIERFGTLFLDPRRAVANERIYIAGHGNGLPKRLSIFEDVQGGPTCNVDNIAWDARNIGYSCDTSGGSSGSPVLAASSHKVIALHHFGGCQNAGARIDLIYAQISTMVVNS